jgi:hypothetical protein
VTYRIQETDLEAAANLLTRAMLRYPVFDYVVSGAPSGATGIPSTRAQENQREAKLRHVFRFILRIAIRHGEVVAPSRNIEAIAVWATSTKLRLPLVEALRAGFLTLPIGAGMQTTRRLLNLAKQKQAHRRKILDCPYHLLDMLAVDPTLQCKGYGRLLLEAKLDELDRVHAQCYLETSDLRNVGYYRRHGFDLMSEHSIESVPVYCLSRSARPQMSEAEDVSSADSRRYRA